MTLILSKAAFLRMEVGKGRMQHTAALTDEHLGSCHIQLLPMMFQRAMVRFVCPYIHLPYALYDIHIHDSLLIYVLLQMMQPQGSVF